MRNASKFDENDGGQKVQLVPGQLNTEAGMTADSEMLLKRAFETDINQGISLLFRWYYKPLCSHAIRYVASKEIAEDIVSDIFYKFHSEQMYTNIDTSFRAYLFTAVRYRSFDYVRAEMRRNTSIQYADYVPLQPDEQPDHITQYEELSRDVESAINTLPIKRRKIYVMHRFEGKKYQEIASELNLSVRTVEAQMYQALHQVRKVIRAKWFFLFLIFIQ
jgi:RNA polymerase sigma-70 factor (ECF subfamily)